MTRIWAALLALVAMLALPVAPASGHKLRAKGEAVTVADSGLTVTPGRDWNRVSGKPGKNAETWTLDGGQLNDLTFFGGIEPGKPLVKERHKKKDPLPKFGKATLLVELPELLEGTYRAYKKIGAFQTLSTAPTKFLGQDGVAFTYEYTDEDQITRKGEAVAAIVGGKLYMVSFDAPRLHYFDRAIGDVRALVATARL
ncbi:hypothetical protein RZN05_11445 [Sphingomonas sp. HF-S4]|uniref:Uncharacterized protein n=1 Tax=Sphingomonas agrestis TaxID=3080540 RepID=A0ABU3Y874_9SPHN|nr:hypothetical protein [Sphingomonas sp. HF-S4]MDV3457600.1 hypothetical protein [Sphingomonas sp. HF-S4]